MAVLVRPVGVREHPVLGPRRESHFELDFLSLQLEAFWQIEGRGASFLVQRLPPSPDQLHEGREHVGLVQHGAPVLCLVPGTE